MINFLHSPSAPCGVGTRVSARGKCCVVPGRLDCYQDVGHGQVDGVVVDDDDET